MHESQLIYSLDTIRMMMFGQAAIITKFLESGVLSILMSVKNFIYSGLRKEPYVNNQNF